MKQVLLHCCCAPCSSAIIEWMLQHDVLPVLYYCNPNIFPEEEYNIRKNEITRYAAELGLTIIDDDYNHQTWLSHIAGLETEPERGSRCLECFKYRLLRSAQKCRELGLTTFTTTLASSRWKRLDQINAAGHWAAEQVNAASLSSPELGEKTTVVSGSGLECALSASTARREGGISFDDRNWRKGGLQERRNELLRINGFYNQQYCGCEFSFRTAHPATTIPSSQP